jgi:biotin synthase
VLLSRHGKRLLIFCTVELVRMVATTRLVLPRATVRLSAGRSDLTRETQILCFVAGANSIFLGEMLLTTPNADLGHDAGLLAAIA